MRSGSRCPLGHPCPPVVRPARGRRPTSPCGPDAPPLPTVVPGDDRTVGSGLALDLGILTGRGYHHPTDTVHAGTAPHPGRH
jgi:hypothetical protein